MKLAFWISALLFMNAIGGVIGKYIALSSGWLAFILIGLLFTSFGIRAVVWMLVGKRFQLSYVYPFISINFILATLLGRWLFQEWVTPGKMIGSVLIVIGVVILSRSRSEVTA